LVVGGLTIELPGRDEEHGQRLVQMLERELAMIDLRGQREGIQLPALDLTMKASASSEEIIETIVRAVRESLAGAQSWTHPVPTPRRPEPRPAHDGGASTNAHGFSSPGDEPVPAGVGTDRAPPPGGTRRT
jgi:hypothetical protein